MDLPKSSLICKECFPYDCDCPTGPAGVFQGRVYDDSNPYGIRCTSLQCRAAGACYCGD